MQAKRGTATKAQRKKVKQQRQQEQRKKIARQNKRSDPILELTLWLANPYIWNWTNMVSGRNCADEVLGKMAELGIIKAQTKLYDPTIWIVGSTKIHPDKLTDPNHREVPKTKRQSHAELCSGGVVLSKPSLIVKRGA